MDEWTGAFLQVLMDGSFCPINSKHPENKAFFHAFNKSPLRGVGYAVTISGLCDRRLCDVLQQHHYAHACMGVSRHAVQELAQK